MGNRELEELVVLWSSSVEREDSATLGKKFVMVAIEVEEKFWRFVLEKIGTENFEFWK